MGRLELVGVGAVMGMGRCGVSLVQHRIMIDLREEDHDDLWGVVAGWGCVVGSSGSFVGAAHRRPRR